jgi:hypothetical protein
MRSEAVAPRHLRLPADIAKLIYDKVRIGTRVVIEA